jgi:DNA-binding LacI/PurR family transcriptional regulator
MLSLSKRTKVRSIILEAIKSGKIRPGDKLENERALCSRLGVSRVTLSKGLNDLVKDGFLFRQVGRGTYLTENSMVLMSSPSKLTISLIISCTESPVVLQLLEGIHNVLSPESCDVILKNPAGNTKLEKKLVKEMVARNVDAIIVSSAFAADSADAIKFYGKIAKPTLVIMTDSVINVNIGRFARIFSDNFEGGKLAAESLLQKKPAGKDFWIFKYRYCTSSLTERMKGFQNIITNQRGKSRVFELSTDEVKCNNELKKIFSENNLPDGIFVTQDKLLSPFVNAIEELKLVLADINVCCYDNFSGLPKLFKIPYIEQSLILIGEEIGQYLKTHINYSNKPIKNITLIPKLMNQNG